MNTNSQQLLARARRLKADLSKTSSNAASPWHRQAQQALDEVANIETILQDVFEMDDISSTEYQNLLSSLEALEVETKGMATPAAPSGPPALQRIPTARISPRTSAPPPRHGPAVAVILETMQGGGTPPPPLPRVNNHTWLSEHLYPVVAAASTSAPTSATPQGGPTHPAGPSWSPFDLDTQPVDTFPIHPSASMSNQPGGVGAGGGTCGVGTPETLDIEDTIGEGGFGVVYKGKVRGPEGEVQVAIKTLKMQVMSPEDRTQFRDESILHIKLRHRNVVRCFAVWDDEPPIKMILEYSEIGSLHRLLRDVSQQQLLTWPNKLQWAKDIAEGIKYLHENRILHGDIKSHNILLFEQQSVDNTGSPLVAKITDFGMARVRAAANNTTNIDTRKGTVAWQPPEAFKSEVRPLKSDVYSFAMVLYEMATGKTPFHDLANVTMILNAIVQQRRPSLEGTTCPAGYRALIEDCWKEEPDQRPDFAEVCTRLQRILDATPPHTASVSYIQFDDGDELDLAESCSIEEFKCPLTLEVMHDPVIIATGITYERSELERWFARGNDTCPFTRKKLSSKELIPNIAMRQRIERWRESMESTRANPAARTHRRIPSSAPSSPANNARGGVALPGSHPIQPSPSMQPSIQQQAQQEPQEPAPLVHGRSVRPQTMTTAFLQQQTSVVPPSAFDEPADNGTPVPPTFPTANLPPRVVGQMSVRQSTAATEHGSSQQHGSNQMPILHSNRSRPSSDGMGGRSSTSRLLHLRNSRLALMPPQHQLSLNAVRHDVPRILKDLKGNDAQFIAAAERLRRLTIDDGTTDWSGYLQNTMSKKELIPLITQVGNSKQVCATKRVAMEAIGNLAMLSRASFDQLVKSNAVVKVAEHLTCHEAACQHAATLSLHMLLEAWNVYGGGRQSEYGEGGEEEISPSPVQYKIGAFQKFLNSTALPVPYVLSKEAAQGLINIIIRASSYTVTQELAADIILEIARDPTRANKLFTYRAIPAALRLITVLGATDVLRLKGLTLLQRLTVPEVNTEKHRTMQATIMKNIMAYTGDTLYDVEGEPVVTAIATQLCSSNEALSERAAQLLRTLASSDEYRLLIAHAKADHTARPSSSARHRTPSVIESSLAMLTPDYTQAQQVAAVRLLHQLALESSGGASVAIVQRRGIQDLGVYVAHPEQSPEGRVQALACLVAIARQVQHQRLMIMSNLVPTLVDVARMVGSAQQPLKYAQLAQLCTLLGQLSPYDDDDSDVPTVVAEGGLDVLMMAYKSNDAGCMVEAGLAMAQLAGRSEKVLEMIYESRMLPVFVKATQSGQGAPHGQRPSTYQVRGAAAAVLAELAQREQYKDEILTAELVPYLLQLIDVRLASEGCMLSACRALAVLASSPSAQSEIACGNGLALLVDLLFRPQEQQFALQVIKEVSEGRDSISNAPLYLQEIMHAKAVPPLISIALDQPSPASQAAALRVLRQLCIDERCRAVVMQGGSGARALVEALRSVPTPAVRLDCVEALTDIASEQRYCHLLEGAVSALVELLDLRAWPHKVQVCRCLRNLAMGSPSLQRSIVEKGCARHLAILLTSNDAAARLAASETVVALAAGRQAVCQDALTATEPLVRALVSLLTGPEATSIQAVVAIRHLSDSNHRSTVRLLQAGVVPPLAGLLRQHATLVQNRAPSGQQGGLVAAPSIAIAGTALHEDITHALSVAETLGTLCKDDRARAEVTRQEFMPSIIPALVQLATHCAGGELETVLSTLALLAQNQPQAQVLMVQQGIVPKLTSAWVQHRSTPGAAVGALKCTVSLGACTDFLAQLDGRLAAQYLLEMMLAPRQPMLNQQATEALKTLLTYSANVRQQVVERSQPFMAACAQLLHSSDKTTLQAAFWSMYIMIKCHSVMADRVAQDRNLAAHFQRLARPASASLLGPEYIAYAVEIMSELQQRNPNLLRT